jgi:hypothetical protein
MPRQPANLPASIHQRLLNLSQARHDEFNQLLTLFAIERLLYRLAQSPHAGCFTFKGALLFLVWAVPVHRPTRDIDLLGFATNSAVALKKESKRASVLLNIVVLLNECPYSMPHKFMIEYCPE